MIRNLVQEHVASHFARLKARFPTFHGCALCDADVQVFALNRLPPRYVATTGGGMLTAVELELGQVGTDIDVMLLEGFRKVAQTPRCGAAPTTLP
ncbi:MAG TPA: late competence development ComFB family protein [Gemmatimonadales bacterium]|nr:late competence development ComFB family protein [Gemmatimonadales bacterium]